MAKKKGNKKALADDVWADNDMVDPIDSLDNQENSDAEANFDGGGLMGLISKSKTKKNKNKAKNAPVIYADDFLDEPVIEPKSAKGKKTTVETPEPEVAIKSKKQKEKERKERLKLEKKQQEGDKGKNKKPAETNDSTTPQSKKMPIPTPAAKGGKKGGNLTALQKMVEAKRAAEEAARIEMEELKRLEEEELERILEEERALEEARALKLEKQRLKKEQLRKDGKLLTKKEKEAKRKQEQFLEQLKASGVQIAGLKDLEDKNSSEKPTQKRVVYDNRKKTDPKSKNISKPKEVIEQPKEEIEKESEKEESGDDWEALLESSEDEEENKDDETKDKSLPGDSNPSTKDSDDESDSDDSGDDSEEDKQAAERKKESSKRRQVRMQAAMDARSEDNLRSPICCILGHVDTGKTKLLDRIRQTDVQGGEAGGITQQIGATYFPSDAIRKKTHVVNKDGKLDIKVPGLLIIDTPGHESFTNLRSRGSSLCNIAILVVDIMHGLEQQTLESLRLLRDKKTPFIVALNKIDRIYGWESTADNGFRLSYNDQKPSVQREFNDRLKSTILAFAEQGLNSKLYYENKNFAKNVSLIPTSAVTGEGVPDLLALLIALTQTRMTSQLMYLSELEATILEVKVIEGLGTTIDVVLSNGVLNEGDRIVLCGLDGPIVTNIRALLTPQPMRELRVKSAYVHHKSIKAAMGVKISAPGLEKSIAGSRLMVVGPEDDEDDLMDEVMSDLISLQDNIDKSGKGVWVQASTLGSLEALLEFLRSSKIPVSGINIGPVYRKDVFRAAAMLERAKEFAVMLCFDVKIDKEAMEYAEEIGVKVFTADIIYHLFDAFVAYNNEMLEQKRKDQAPQVVFPCILKMIPGAAFNKRDPIVIGVDVLEGQLRLGTPISVVNINTETKTREIVSLGKVTSMEINHKVVTVVKRGEAGAGVAIKIECPVYDTPKLLGRHFDEKNEFYSHITRTSIDILKESFRNELSKDDWALVIKLKKILDVK
ncbi:hypothetical protein BB561_006638 [Smittium simulii]|uniref:Eukaryotic translation initiation factor 5B n=1 Tax=Smittium simulii TaxID=133385 RepID=A0A2T9Y2P3_9FUNG|nr:hypothetical protein BB561_006638 [Smittium simulii]